MPLKIRSIQVVAKLEISDKPWRVEWSVFSDPRTYRSDWFKTEAEAIMAKNAINVYVSNGVDPRC